MCCWTGSPGPLQPPAPYNAPITLITDQTDTGSDALGRHLDLEIFGSVSAQKNIGKTILLKADAVLAEKKKILHRF